MSQEQQQQQLQQPSTPLAANVNAPITAAEMFEMLRQFARQQNESVQHQVQEVLHQFQQSQASSTATAAARAAAAAAAAASTSSSSLSAGPLLPHHVKLGKPMQFTGAANANVDTWLFEMEQYQTASGITEDNQRIILALSYLKESASQWWLSICNSPLTKPTTWENFKTTMRARFQPLAASRTARANLRNLRQGHKTVSEYSNTFLRQMQLINDMSEVDKIEHFVMGLQSAVANQVELKDPQTLTDAMNWAQRTELLLRNQRHSSAHYSNYSNSNRYNAPTGSTYESKTTTTRATAAAPSAPMELGNISASSSNEDEYEKYLEQGDEYEPAVEVEEEGDAIESESEEQLHALHASTPNRTRVPNISREEFYRLMRERKCLRCKKPGHIARNCPQLPHRGSHPARRSNFE